MFHGGLTYDGTPCLTAKQMELKSRLPVGATSSCHKTSANATPLVESSNLPMNLVVHGQAMTNNQNM
jgi:hypothetical protein